MCLSVCVCCMFAGIVDHLQSGYVVGFVISRNENKGHMVTVNPRGQVIAMENDNLTIAIGQTSAIIPNRFLSHRWHSTGLCWSQ